MLVLTLRCVIHTHFLSSQAHDWTCFHLPFLLTVATEQQLMQWDWIMKNAPIPIHSASPLWLNGEEGGAREGRSHRMGGSWAWDDLDPPLRSQPPPQYCVILPRLHMVSWSQEIRVYKVRKVNWIGGSIYSGIRKLSFVVEYILQLLWNPPTLLSVTPFPCSGVESNKLRDESNWYFDLSLVPCFGGGRLGGICFHLPRMSLYHTMLSKPVKRELEALFRWLYE